MFKLNNKSKKIMKALSLGIVSLGLLAGVGMTSSKSSVHAMTAEQLFNDPYLKAEDAKDEADADAIGAKEAQEAGPSEAKVERENLVDNNSKQYVESYDKKHNIHTTYPVKAHAKYKKLNKHARKHNKNLARNKRAKRVYKNKKAHKHYSHKKLNKSHKAKSNRRAKRLTKKQLNHINGLIKKNNKDLKSKKAKHNYKYRKALLKKNQSLKKLLKSRK